MSVNREEKKRITKKAIVVAAIELFAEQGYEKTSISQLAKAAGVGKGTVYSYFSTKHDILLGICDDELEYIHRQLTSRTDTDAPVIEQLTIIFLAEFEYVTRNREFGRLYMQEILFPREISSSKYKQMENKYFEMIFPILEKGQERGELRKDLELLHICGHFFALFILVVHAWYTNIMQSEEAGETIHTLFEQAISGLQPQNKSLSHTR